MLIGALVEWSATPGAWNVEFTVTLDFFPPITRLSATMFDVCNEYDSVSLPIP
jgi:hypothetical protein